jgi:hypothetical protein
LPSDDRAALSNRSRSRIVDQYGAATLALRTADALRAITRGRDRTPSISTVP